MSLIDRGAIERGIVWQADHAAANGAPGTGRLCRALLALDDRTEVGRRIRHWPGDVLEDAMPLRIAGGLHALHRRGDAPGLGPVYAGALTDQAAIDTIVRQLVAAHDAFLAPWLDGPPQTNEAARSANFVMALHWLAARGMRRFELNEIGSSGGMNLLIDRWRYDLGGVASGPADGHVIRPDWRGPPPPDAPFAIESVRGSDIRPIDLSDPANAERLTAYIWPELADRFDRFAAGVAMIRTRPPRIDRAEAADWVEARLAEPQPDGVTRVLMHSIVWQYLPPSSKARITAAMETAGAAAPPARPLAWIATETDRARRRHATTVRFWPGSAKGVVLGHAHAHGVWVEMYGAAPAASGG